jgi:hypothetical protein
MFNLLDASGGIGVTERTAYILRVRQLAVAIAKHWVGASALDKAGSEDPALQPTPDAGRLGSSAEGSAGSSDPAKRHG